MTVIDASVLKAAFDTDPQVVYLLTDGDFPDNAGVLRTVRDLNRFRPVDKKVKISAVAFVNDGEAWFVVLLKTVSRETGGIFRCVRSDS